MSDDFPHGSLAKLNTKTCTLLINMSADLHLVSKQVISYPLKAIEYAAQPVPFLHEFEKLWAAWDIVTRHMIPEDELLSKPIKLRNCCLFYLGHIPAFLDIHLTRATGDAATKPSYYQHIFERGIDPDVDNPENCHAHSEIPDEWPPVSEILNYQEEVRDRTRSLFHQKSLETNRKLARAMWIGFEHEGRTSPLFKRATAVVIDVCYDQLCTWRHFSTCSCKVIEPCLPALVRIS